MKATEMYCRASPPRALASQIAAIVVDAAL